MPAGLVSGKRTVVVKGPYAAGAYACAYSASYAGGAACLLRGRALVLIEAGNIFTHSARSFAAASSMYPFWMRI